MKILLLGASGLLGNNVLQVAIDAGHEVKVLVRDPRRLVCPAAQKADISIGSPLNHADLCAAMTGCDAVINCIGETNMGLRKLEEFLPANVDCCSMVLKVMEELSIGKLVHVSTANTIGYGTADCMATEECAPQAPFASSLYTKSKLMAEQQVKTYAQVHPNQHIIIVNPGFMVGSFDRRPSSGALLLAAYRRHFMVVPADGGKSFIHVKDAAEAVVNALELGTSGSNYLLTNENMGLREFYQLQASVCGYRQRLIRMPRWLVLSLGRVGDWLRALGFSISLSSNNVAQLMTREYYSSRKAVQDLHLKLTPIEYAISDFFTWHGNRKQS